MDAITGKYYTGIPNINFNILKPSCVYVAVNKSQNFKDWEPVDEDNLTMENWLQRCMVKPFLSNTESRPYDERMAQGEWSRQKNVNRQARCNN